MRTYNALLLAAGFGSRLKPLTNSWPKCLMPVKGVPLLDYWLHSLYALNIGEIIVNTHHLNEEVDGFLSRNAHRDRVRILHEVQLLGTAGTIRRVHNIDNKDPMIVIHADNLCICNFQSFMQFHEYQRPLDCPMTMMTFSTPEPKSCGIIKTDNLGRVTEMYEKVSAPPGNIANAGVYILEPEALDWISKKPNTSDITTEVIPNFMGKIATWQNFKIHRDVGSHKQLAAAQDDEVEGILKMIPKNDHWYSKFVYNPVHSQIAKLSEKFS